MGRFRVHSSTSLKTVRTFGIQSFWISNFGAACRSVGSTCNIKVLVPQPRPKSWHPSQPKSYHQLCFRLQSVVVKNQLPELFKYDKIQRSYAGRGCSVFTPLPPYQFVTPQSQATTNLSTLGSHNNHINLKSLHSQKNSLPRTNMIL
uniref:Protein ARV1 n=1 Tax=Lygus hesperus TaxID=30085 RepID=A0A0A9VT96_LYGHE